MPEIKRGACGGHGSGVDIVTRLVLQHENAFARGSGSLLKINDYVWRRMINLYKAAGVLSLLIHFMSASRMSRPEMALM